MVTQQTQFGVIGLAVMGENLALNIESRGFFVSVFNRTTSRTEHFLSTRAKDKKFFGAKTLEEFCQSLERPRKIMMMIQAGKAVDQTIEQLLPYLEKGDILIDGGNSFFEDTERRVKALEDKEIRYVGCGVSGGELGALHGPSLMPGGDTSAWEFIRPFFEKITAKVGSLQESCCTWIGNGGSGHFVKMVHNGIEYGDMQVISEGYDLCKNILLLDNQHIADCFSQWNQGRLNSYLIEITAQILQTKDADQSYLVDKVLDKAGQKGTGKWTAITALNEGIPLNFITESVFARAISSQWDLRQSLSKLYNNEIAIKNIPFTLDDVEAAIFASKLISYAQGFELITAQSSQRHWNIHPHLVAKIWRGGCIIRSTFLDALSEALENADQQTTLLLSQFYQDHLPSAIQSLRKVIAGAAVFGRPLPGMCATLSYFDAIRSARLPANLLQAQRDFFGAHTYERIDMPQGQFFHTNWTGEGGDTVSSTYNA